MAERVENAKERDNKEIMDKKISHELIIIYEMYLPETFNYSYFFTR